MLESPPRKARFPTELLVIPANEARGPRHYADPHIEVALCGLGRRGLRVAARQMDLGTRPGMIELYAEGYEIAQTRWAGQQGQCVAVSFPRAATDRFLRDDGRRFELTTAHEVFDEQVARLGYGLAEEVRQGMPNGVLFAEGLSIALMGLLAHRYAPVRRSGCPRAALSNAQQRIIRELVDGDLASELTIERMAALLGMSPFQFSRRFKSSFGLSPHQYVMQRRLETAADKLRGDRSRPIVDIALEVGFSSQAHFTAAFRRHTGTTPARARWS